MLRGVYCTAILCSSCDSVHCPAFSIVVMGLRAVTSGANHPFAEAETAWTEVSHSIPQGALCLLGTPPPALLLSDMSDTATPCTVQPLCVLCCRLN